MKESSFEGVVEFGERVLAQIARGHQYYGKRALMSRREDAVLVCIAKKSSEHHCTPGRRSCNQVQAVDPLNAWR